MQDSDKEAPAVTESSVAETAIRHEPAGSPETMPSPEDLLKTAELKAEEHHDAWLRAKAETENVRRRAQEDIAKAGKFAAEKFAGEMLAVKDSLEAAIAASASQNQDADTLRAGVEVTLKQLVGAFERSNITEINPLEEKFDPHKHQAISQMEADGEPNRVINVLQKGYALHDRILRPALVIVSKAKVSDGGTPAA